MKESFVFHKEFFEDIPETEIARFTIQIIEYGLYGKEPQIEKGTFEYKCWMNIKNRIDEDSSKYEKVSEKRREAAKKRYEKYNDTEKSATENKEFTKPTEKDDFVNQSEKTEEQTNKNKKFEKPTVEEVKEYCEQRKNGIDAQTFWDFYESKGWFVGSHKMKDWQSAVRNWENRKKTENNGGHTKGIIGNENEVSAEYFDLL